MVSRIVRFRRGAWVGLAIALSLTCSAVTMPPTNELKALAFANRPGEARALFEGSRDPQQPLDAEWLEAMSWVARAGAIAGDWEQAETYADRTMGHCEDLLSTTSLGADPQAPLPIALGAAIETLGKAYVAAGDTTQAVLFLRDQIRKYSGSPIETRLNKNLLLLDLAGKPMPELDTRDWLNSERLEATDLEGQVGLFYFWAHWCSDCRAQKPVLVELVEELEDRGLRVVAPTRLYGFISRGTEAAQQVERDYIVRSQIADSTLLQHVPVPLGSENFVRFGVSTTPTLVLVDREGVVRLYHPGAMEKSDLRSRIEALL